MQPKPGVVAATSGFGHALMHYRKQQLSKAIGLLWSDNIVIGATVCTCAFVDVSSVVAVVMLCAGPDWCLVIRQPVILHGVFLCQLF